MAEKQSKIDNLIKEIESLTVLELNELVKSLEEKFGVSATAVAPAPVAATTVGQAAAEAGGEEKNEYTVELTAAGSEKIKVIKAVRELNPQLGLKEAKDLVEAAPNVVIEKAKKEEAEEARKKLEAAGAKVVLK
jgi:large subunit ribosomal protein L7/L12